MALFISVILIGVGLAFFGVGGNAWSRAGYKNVVLALWWGIAGYILFGFGALFTYYSYVIKPSKAAEEVRRQPNRVPHSQTGPLPFAIQVNIGLETNERRVNSGVAYYEGYSQPKVGKIISPIHRMYVIRITNLQAVRSQVETYRVESRTEGRKWVELTWIEGAKGRIYFIFGDPSRAGLLDLPILDTVLSDRDINPNQTVQGWAFFELPESVSGKQPIRVSVKDFNGAAMSQIINYPPSGFTQGAEILPRGVFDLSSATLQYYSETKRQTAEQN